MSPGLSRRAHQAIQFRQGRPQAEGQSRWAAGQCLLQLLAGGGLLQPLQLDAAEGQLIRRQRSHLPPSEVSVVIVETQQPTAPFLQHPGRRLQRLPQTEAEGSVLKPHR